MTVRNPSAKKILIDPWALSRLVTRRAPNTKMNAARMRLMAVAWENEGLIQSSMWFPLFRRIVLGY